MLMFVLSAMLVSNFISRYLLRLILIHRENNTADKTCFRSVFIFYADVRFISISGFKFHEYASSHILILIHGDDAIKITADKSFFRYVFICYTDVCVIRNVGFKFQEIK